jgi:hypothetical protein
MHPLVTAAIAFCSGYLLAQLNAYAERDRRTPALATAMLLEMDLLEANWNT